MTELKGGKEELSGTLCTGAGDERNVGLLQRRGRFCAPKLLCLSSEGKPAERQIDPILPSLAPQVLPTGSGAAVGGAENLEPATSSTSSAFGRNPVWEQFDVRETLGRGAVGVVYRALKPDDPGGQEVVLKVVDTTDQAMGITAKVEYDMLRQLSSPYIIRAYDFFESGVQAVLVLEYFPGLTLTQTVCRAQQRRLKERVAKLLFSALMQSLEYLHGRGIVHRDVKPDNVLVTLDNVELRLIDFHTARKVEVVSEENTSPVFSTAGTTLFASPEVVRFDEPALEANDIWAAGLCLYFMLSRRLPRGCGESEFEEPVFFEENVWSKISEPCKEVLRQCCAIDKRKRPMVPAILKSAWLMQVESAAPFEASPGLQVDSWSSTPSTSTGATALTLSSRTWSPISPLPFQSSSFDLDANRGAPLNATAAMLILRCAAASGQTPPSAEVDTRLPPLVQAVASSASAVAATASRIAAPASAVSDAQAEAAVPFVGSGGSGSPTATGNASDATAGATLLGSDGAGSGVGGGSRLRRPAPIALAPIHAAAQSAAENPEPIRLEEVNEAVTLTGADRERGDRDVRGPRADTA